LSVLQKLLSRENIEPGEIIHSAGKESSAIDWVLDQSILPCMLGFSKLGYHVGKIFWDTHPNLLTDKKVVITGATSGIGKAAAMQLARLESDLTFIAGIKKKHGRLKMKLLK